MSIRAFSASSASVLLASVPSGDADGLRLMAARVGLSKSWTIVTASEQMPVFPRVKRTDFIRTTHALFSHRGK